MQVKVPEILWEDGSVTALFIDDEVWRLDYQPQKMTLPDGTTRISGLLSILRVTLHHSGEEIWEIVSSVAVDDDTEGLETFRAVRDCWDVMRDLIARSRTQRPAMPYDVMVETVVTVSKVRSAL